MTALDAGPGGRWLGTRLSGLLARSGAIGTVGRLTAVVAVLLGILLVPVVSPASAAGSGLRLVSQSPWVLSGQTFDLTVALPPGTPPDDRIQVFGYARLTTRTGFNQSLSGQMNGSARWHFYPTPVSQVPTDAAGDAVFRIPVDTSAANSPFSSFYTSASQGPGVFPLQVRLFNSDGVPVGQPLTTFLVYGGSPEGNGTPKLSVSLTIPFHAAPALGPTLVPQRLGSQASSELAALARVLAVRADVPLSLLVTPQTLDALAMGTATDRATLGQLAGLPASDQVLPATYVPSDLPGMVAAGLDNEITAQLQAGATTLASRLHKTPSTRTWVTSGPLDEVTAADLVRRGISQLIVPNGDLERAAFQRAGDHVRPTERGDRSVVEPACGWSRHRPVQAADFRWQSGIGRQPGAG